MGDDESSGGIAVFLRVKPSKLPPCVRISDFDENVVKFSKQLKQKELELNNRVSYNVNNSKSDYAFSFNGIFNQEATQEEVFKKVGLPSVQNVMQGYNSTIFAYGQTGSGKTYTLTGAEISRVDRGVIPRAIEEFFGCVDRLQKESDSATICSCFVSYLEIYNDTGYDLLDTINSHRKKRALGEADATKPSGLQKVTMLEDEDGNFHFRNLSWHPVGSVNDALYKLFQGEDARFYAETEMNLTSSRSHCLFTLLLEKREHGSDRVIRSKLNLVDLAGSERVGKTHSAGQTLNEAKYINSSLHFLELVIIALADKEKGNRAHIPYRNSMMTSVLRDSLGGNCKTQMIATISSEIVHVEESISTCQFAQRVALVKNTAKVNEDLEPEAVIIRLKEELVMLREQVKFLKGENGEEAELTTDQVDNLVCSVNAYVADPDPRSRLNMGKITLSKLDRVFPVFKTIALKSRSDKDGSSDSNQIELQGTGNAKELEEEIFSLKGELKKRNEEIAILVQMIKNGKTIKESANLAGVVIATTASCGVELCFEESVLNDPSSAFDWFKARSNHAKSMNENTLLLKEKAKVTGEDVKNSRTRIAFLKSNIEDLRNSMASDLNDGGVLNLASRDEEEFRYQLELVKAMYQDKFNKLKELKDAIERTHAIMERGKRKLKKDFDQWYHLSCEGSKYSVRQSIATKKEGNEVSTTSDDLKRIKKQPNDLDAFREAQKALLKMRTENN